MKNDFDHTRLVDNEDDEGRLEEAAQILLQHFIDGNADDRELERMVGIWNRLPRTENDARNNMEIERLFKYRNDLNSVVPPLRLEELKEAARNRFGLPSPPEHLMLSDLDIEYFDDLVLLEKNAVSLVPSIESPRTENRRTNEKTVIWQKIRHYLPSSFKIVLAINIFLTVGILVQLGLMAIKTPISRNAIESPVNISARISDLIDVQWMHGTEIYKIGQEIEAGRLKIQEGIARIVFTNGAEAILEGPVDFIVKGKNNAFCSSGKISVQIPPSAHGFEVNTPIGRVIDLGTAFTMLVDENELDVHVIDGKVQLGTMISGFRTLSIGEAIKVDIKGTNHLKRADRSLYFSKEKFSAKKRDYDIRREAAYHEKTDALNNHRSLVYRLDPNRAKTLTKTKGGRENNVALRFSDSFDRLDVPVVKELQSMTLLASIRLDGMKHVSNTLLMGDFFFTKPGEFLWQLDRSGAFQFHLNYGGSGCIAPYDSDPVVQRKDWKTWIVTALVADSEKKTISHYCDGQIVSTLPWNDPRPLRLNGATIGNEPSSQRKYAVRYFNGDIEDFWIFDRPFTPDEVKQFCDDIR